MKFAEQTQFFETTAFMDVIARLMDAVANQVRNRWVCFYRNGFVFALCGFVGAGLPPRCGGYCGQVSGSDERGRAVFAAGPLGPLRSQTRAIGFFFVRFVRFVVESPGVDRWVTTASGTLALQSVGGRPEPSATTRFI